MDEQAPHGAPQPPNEPLVYRAGQPLLAEPTKPADPPAPPPVQESAPAPGGHPGPAGEPSAHAEGKEKHKPTLKRTLISLLISLLVIAAGVVIILYAVAWASDYGSVSEMLGAIFEQLGIMWARVTA